VKSPSAWPRQPFLGVALAAICGVLLADNWPTCSIPLAAGFGGLSIIGWFARRSLIVYCVTALGFFLVHSVAISDSPGRQLANTIGDQAQPATVEGTVITEPKMSDRGSSSFLLQVRSIEIDGETRACHAKLFARWRHPLEFGDDIRVFGTIQVIEGPRNPGEFDMRSYLRRQDVHRALIIRYPENGAVLGRRTGDRILRAAQKSRNWMQAVLSRGLENSPDVVGAINGMVLGLRHQTADDIEEPFQQTGTLHLFAVAGLHVGIVARLLWIVARAARLPRKWATALIIPALLFYAAITGLHTSSLRAAVMSGVLLGGFIVERKAFAFNSLAAAAVLILSWNTNELFAVGFQLSFCVVGAILLLHEPTFSLLRRAFASDPFLPRSLFTPWRRFGNTISIWLCRAAGVSFAAWVGSLPLMFWYYHLVTLTSLVANLVVVPIAFFVLAGALLSLLAAPVSHWLSLVFNNANWALTKLILGAVHLFAQIPGGHFYVEHPHRPSGAQVEINVLDFRSGAAIHLRSRNHDWLVDSGPARDYERVVCPYLRARGVDRLDGLILTHGDAAHIGAARSVILDFRPGEVIDPAAADRSGLHRKFLDWLHAEKRLPRLSYAGDQIRIAPGVDARVLFPPAGFRGDRADDQAVVLQLVVDGRTRALLMSDSGEETEKAVLRDHPDLRSAIVIKGQHHSGVSGSPPFLDGVRPEVIVATSRDFPDSERLKPEWIADLERRGIGLLRQDLAGAVQVRLLDDRWEATSYVTGEVLRSQSR
jgi:ComEC/Rec2-related protein